MGADYSIAWPNRSFERCAAILLGRRVSCLYSRAPASQLPAAVGLLFFVFLSPQSSCQWREGVRMPLQMLARCGPSLFGRPGQ